METFLLFSVLLWFLLLQQEKAFQDQTEHTVAILISYNFLRHSTNPPSLLHFNIPTSKSVLPENAQSRSHTPRSPGFQ